MCQGRVRHGSCKLGRLITLRPTRGMSDPHSGRSTRAGERHAGAPAERRSLFQRLVELVSPGPESRDELIDSLADAEHKELIPPESRMMLEGVIRMADMSAGDVMVPNK